MKFRREARSLKAKAICSLRRSTAAFNDWSEDGRTTCVLLHMQHAAEMLLKAILVQKKVKVFDPAKHTSIGFAKCVNLACQHAQLTPEEAGLLRTIDELRDGEQHWLIVVPEELLYLHARGFATTFDDLLKRIFDDRLADHLPSRVLPISTHPQLGFDLLIDREFTQIKELLQPGKRRRDEARGRIRTLLAMESHVADGVDVSETDIDRIESAVRSGKDRADIFPRLNTIDTVLSGSGTAVTVHFTKRTNEGAPVRYIGADDPTEAAAVREVDLQKRFHISRSALAEKLNISSKRAKDLRKKLGIDEDPLCMHIFKFNESKFPMFSDKALLRLRSEIKQPA
jgi:hypothetical protein